MRGTWIVAAAIALGLVLVGFFAQGMSRLAGLPTDAAKALPALATATAATESAKPPAISPALNSVPPSTASPAQASESTVDLPTESRLLQAIANAPDTAPEVWPPLPTPPRDRVSHAVAHQPPVVIAAVPPIAPTAPSLRPEERRLAQCESLRAWLVELDVIARTRGDASTQAWVQGQRSTTRERETELRCHLVNAITSG